MDSVVFAYIEELDCADLAEGRDSCASNLGGNKELHKSHLLRTYNDKYNTTTGPIGDGVRRSEE